MRDAQDFFKELSVGTLLRVATNLGLTVSKTAVNGRVGSYLMLHQGDLVILLEPVGWAVDLFVTERLTQFIFAGDKVMLSYWTSSPVKDWFEVIG